MHPESLKSGNHMVQLTSTERNGFVRHEAPEHTEQVRDRTASIYVELFQQS